MVTYILSQVCVFIAFSIDVSSYFFKVKKNFLLICIIYSCFYVLSYILLQSYLGAVANAIFLIRNIWYVIYNNKNKSLKSYILPIIVLNAAFITAFVFLYSSPLDSFLIVSMLLLTIAFAFKNMLVIRICATINNVFWGFYNFIIKGYVNFACNVFMFIAILTAIFIYHILPKIKERKEQKNTQKL